ncbi:MAG: hypothetical protein FWG46_02145, partial [Treponema sp.]|nr:hypothetical protein [Treponema sp.]
SKNRAKFGDLTQNSSIIFKLFVIFSRFSIFYRFFTILRNTFALEGILSGIKTDNNNLKLDVGDQRLRRLEREHDLLLPSLQGHQWSGGTVHSHLNGGYSMSKVGLAFYFLYVERNFFMLQGVK